MKEERTWLKSHPWIPYAVCDFPIRVWLRRRSMIPQRPSQRAEVVTARTGERRGWRDKRSYSDGAESAPTEARLSGSCSAAWQRHAAAGLSMPESKTSS